MNKFLNSEYGTYHICLEKMNNKNQNEQFRIISNKLDRITVILLAQSGLKQKEIAEIFEVSEKTIERMFSGHFNKIKRPNAGQEQVSEHG